MSTDLVTLADRCARIELLMLDVDGVLTDGRIIYGEQKVESEAFHVRDGAGVVFWQGAGKAVGIISGRNSPAVFTRAKELGLDPLLQGVSEKWPAVKQVLKARTLTPEQLCFVGDDLPDLPILRRCGLAIAPADASAEVRTQAHYVTLKPGGQGAVREAIELILRCQGKWAKIVEAFQI